MMTRLRLFAGALLCAVSGAQACATGGADDPPGSGGTQASGGADASIGGNSGSGGASGGTAGSGGTGGSGGSAASAGAGGTGGGGAPDASLDAVADADAAMDAGADAPYYDAAGCTATPPAGGCPSGQYFHVCKNACVSCADFSLVQLPTAALVGSLSDTTGGIDQLYARVGLVGATQRVVWSQRVTPNAPTQRDFATAQAQGNDWATISTNLGNFVNYPSADEEAPSVIPAGAIDPRVGSAATEALLLMDSDRDGKREIYVSNFFKSAGSPVKLAAPVNAGTRDYHASYAHAASPARLFWSSARGQSVGLHAWALSGGAVTLVSLTHTNGCKVSEEDLEASVSADGQLLVFSAARRSPPDCNTALNAGRRSVFYAYLDPATGQAISPAFELDALRLQLEQLAGSAAINLRAPAFEPGGCTLYFSSDADPGDKDYDVYRATR
ncbi:MAG: hypothetical protein R3B13_30980 [Polyangiaceae bacterium]